MPVIVAGLALQVDDNLIGPTLRCVELAGNNLELRQSIARELRLAEGGVRTVCRDLLVVEVELLAPTVQTAQSAVVRDRIAPDARHKLRKIKVIAAVQRQLCKRLRIDLACHLR